MALNPCREGLSPDTPTSNVAGTSRFAQPQCPWLTVHIVPTLSHMATQGQLSKQALAALHRLVSLFGITTLLTNMGDLMEDDYASRQQVSLIRQQQYALLRELRPDAVALVDGFGFEDYLLNSSLGRSVHVLLAVQQALLS